ncbi:MAG TPA: phosphatase PAP2 family protein [Acidimicrobiales bacterium]|nr:phosphatase PAP2 family protein [Acidimicrobiales bacterium]
MVRPTRRRPSGAPPPLPKDLRRSGLVWAALAGAVLLFWFVLFLTGRRPSADLVDRAILREVAEWRTPSLTRFMRGVQWLGDERVLLAVSAVVLTVAAAFRRFRHVLVFGGCALFAIWLTSLVQIVLARPRPVNVPILGEWDGFSHPSRPMVGFGLTLVGIAYTLVPQGRWRVARGAEVPPEQQRMSAIVWVIGALLLLLGFAQIYLAVENPTDVLVGAIVGVAIPTVAFRLLAPAEVFPITYRRQRTAHVDVGGRRGEAICRALTEQLGLEVVSVEPFALEGSWGSTPLLLKLATDDPPALFGKLYTATHLRSDRWYKLGRTLLYGRLEDEATYSSVRRLVEYEDYLLRLMGAHGLPVAECYGFVEITPEREYLIVTEFLQGAVEIGDVRIDESVIDDGLAVVRRLWDAGLAHRDIKPANVLLRNGKVFLVDLAFAEVRPSPWRQAVDLANMMLVLALSSDPHLVYARARLLFSDAELAEAFAATRGVTMPAQLRARLREDGRDCLRRMRELAPDRPPIRIQHWSLRRLGLSAAVLAGAALALLGVFNAMGDIRVL